LLQFDLPKEIADKVIAFASTLSDEDIYIDEKDPSYGRIKDPHITVLYGLSDEFPDEVKHVAKDIKPVIVEIGDLSLFTDNPKFIVLKFEIKSSELEKLNSKLKNELEYTSSYVDYNPHMIVAYLKKDMSNVDTWVNSLNNSLNGTKIEFKTLMMSSKNGDKYPVALRG